MGCWGAHQAIHSSIPLAKLMKTTAEGWCRVDADCETWYIYSMMLHVSATGCEASWRIHVRIHLDDFQSSKKNNVWGEDTADNVLKMISNPFRSFHLGLLQLVYHKISMLILIEKMLPKHQILGVYPVISLPHFWTQPYGAWKPVGCAAAHHCITASTAARPPAERGSICPRATCSRFEMWSRRHQMAITWRCYDSSPKLLWQWLNDSFDSFWILFGSLISSTWKELDGRKYHLSSYSCSELFPPACVQQSACPFIIKILLGFPG